MGAVINMMRMISFWIRMVIGNYLRKEAESKNKVINKLLETIENIGNKAVQCNPLPIPRFHLEDDSMIRTNLREKRSKYQKSIIQVTSRKTLSNSANKENNNRKRTNAK